LKAEENCKTECSNTTALSVTERGAVKNKKVIDFNFLPEWADLRKKFWEQKQ
jgi:hypothetical protein